MQVRYAVSAEDVARGALSLDWLASDVGALSWVESRPDARARVVSWEPGRGGLVEHGEGIGNALHAYGARPYRITSNGMVATLVRDGQVWDLATGTRLTGTAHQHGDLHVDGERICCVREAGDGDELLIINRDSGSIDVVHRAPFVAAPRLSGDQLAWTQWDADTMPWDSAEVWTGTYRPGAPMAKVHCVAGGPAESAHQPSWGPDGSLYLLSDRTGWWNLYRWRGDLQPVAPIAAECGAAPWESGYTSYTFLHDGPIAMIVENGPVGTIAIVATDGKIHELATPFTSFKPFLAPVTGGIAVIGANVDTTPQIAVCRSDGSGAVEVIRSGEAISPLVTPPSVVRVEAAEELTVLVHPPATGTTGPAPLILRVHPGPTDQIRLRRDEEVQFFTSRGFLVAELDHRGSTGHGRRFRTALNGRWGEADVEDCFAVAAHLVRTGQARSDALFITGASAGGYTAVRAVSRPDTPFAVAVARSAIIAPNTWITTAPRFQRAHAATLAHHAADVDATAVSRPVLLIHGDVDPVAPIADAAQLADALRDRGLLLGFEDIPGCGHYLSGPALATALARELEVYERHLSTAHR